MSDSLPDIIATCKSVLLQAYSPTGPQPPPKDTAPTAVRFFASMEGVPATWINPGGECPLLWVRLSHRFRSRLSDFPAAVVSDGNSNACLADIKRVACLEIGVGRCTSASMEADPDWKELEAEAELGLDDSRRIEASLGRILSELRTPQRAVAIDTVAPYGPEGGITAWTGLLFVQL